MHPTRVPQSKVKYPIRNQATRAALWFLVYGYSTNVLITRNLKNVHRLARLYSRAQPQTDGVLKGTLNLKCASLLNVESPFLKIAIFS
jgi:hypothetical protein